MSRPTPAEAERLHVLIEEAGEVIQIACKILRHGYESYHPDVDDKTNRDELMREMGDLRYAMTLLAAADDVERDVVVDYSVKKAIKIQEWLHHQSNKLLEKAAAHVS